MDAAPATPEPRKKSRLVEGVVVGAGVVLFFLYTFYCGTVTDFWFEETLQGTFSAEDVDRIASGFVTNLDVRIITPDDTRVYTPNDTAELQQDVHELLDPLVGRQSGGARTHVNSDDIGECEANYGDTRVKLELLPTDIGHAITTLEVAPRSR